ncbi:MAG: hypothetical protein FD123_4128, partial [Bacteroidetes bacterium]
DAGTDYNVIVSGSFVPDDTSMYVSLVIDITPVITVQPVNQSLCEGDSVNFSVTATGTGLTYQWRKGTLNLVNTGNISGATSVTLTINPATVSDAGNNYNVIVSSACGNDTSINVSLAVDTATVIIPQPAGQTVCEGDSVSFSVTATGTGITYQWRKRKGTLNLVDGGNISGATSATLIINPATVSDAGTNYNVIVSGTCGNDTSINISLAVNTAPVITSGPASQTVCEGDSVSFSVTATGTGLTYQWRKGMLNLVNAGNISGATSAILTINPVTLSDAGTDYHVIVSGSCTPDDTSILATLSVNPAPVAVAGSNSPVCAGTTINLTTQPVAGATYLWTGPGGYVSTDQNPVILSAAATDGGTYFLTVSANGCTSAPSTAAVAVNDCDTMDFFLPEGFSPNGDGINDLFVIRGIGYYPANVFIIFNRWGNKVFEAGPYQNTWDGKSTTGIRIGGDELPVGTYFYILDLGNNTAVIKGTIYLNR